MSSPPSRLSAGRPVVLYVEAHGDGHRTEHLAFYMGVARAAGVGLRVHAPRKLFDNAARLAGPEAAACAEHGRDVQVGQGQRREMLQVLDAAFADARANGVARLHFAMLDDFLSALALRCAQGRRPPVPWSALFFRDGFNYPRDEARWPALKAKSAVKRAVLQFVLSCGAAELWTLNPVWRSRMPVPVRWLPDALSSIDRMAEAAADDGWPIPQSDPDPDRVRLLSFGAIAPRKGVLQTLQALASLSDVELARIEYRVLGRFVSGADELRAHVERLMSELQSRGAKTELLAEYVSEPALDAALRRCDYIVAPYLHHMGSSGVLGLAAQYGRPLLSQDSYQMGEEVRRFGLGLTVDPNDLPALAVSLQRLIAREIGVTPQMAEVRRSRNTQAAHAAGVAAFRALATEGAMA